MFFPRSRGAASHPSPRDGSTKAHSFVPELMVHRPPARSSTTRFSDDSHNNQAEKSERKRLLYVCRVLHNTVWVAGTQKGDEKRCTVTIHESVQSYDKYELLENVDNAARVSWQHWDKYRPTPIGAVATEKMMFVARHAVHNDKDASDAAPRYNHYIGTLNSNDNLGTISYVRDVSNCRREHGSRFFRGGGEKRLTRLRDWRFRSLWLRCSGVRRWNKTWRVNPGVNPKGEPGGEPGGWREVKASL